MATFEIQGPNGKTYEVEAPDMESAVAALGQMASASPKPDANLRNPDGTYGQTPEGFVLNPTTGQMEDMRSPNNPNIPTGRGTALALGAGQGLGFGSLDEVVAGGRAAIGGGYDYELGRMREAERRAKEENPGYYYGGLVPGAVASSVSAGKALGVNPQGANLLGTSARGAAIGGGEGALWGALSGEGGAANRGREAVVNALMGAGVGAAAPSVIGSMAWGGRKAADLVGGGIDATIGRANQGRANRSVMDMMRKAGVSVDQATDDVARAAQEGQPEFRLMDAAGIAGQRRASGITRSGGDGAEEIAQFLRQRQVDQADRVGGFVDDAFGLGGKTAAQRTSILTAARKTAADTAYEAARGNAVPVDVRGALSVIDDRIGGMQGSGVTGDGIDAALSRYRSRLAARNPASSAIPGQGADTTKTAVELSDFNRVLGVKQEVQDAVGAAVRAGRNNEARELGKLVNALDQALEEASPLYRSANDEFARSSRVIDAVDEGAGMASRGRRAGDTVPRFQGMTPDEQAAARAGYGDKAMARIEANTAPSANVAKPFTSTKATTEADAMTVDPRLFRDRLAREGAMWEVQNRALGGSRTADNLSDVADVGLMADMGRATTAALTGRIGDAIGTAARYAGNAATGQNEATRTLIARILMSSDPKKSLALALRQEATSEGRKRIAEAMTRALGREFIPTP